MALPQIRCKHCDHAKQYDNDGVCHNKRNDGSCMEYISRNDYGNAIIGSYGGYFEEGYMVGVMHRRKLHRTREASNGEG